LFACTLFWLVMLWYEKDVMEGVVKYMSEALFNRSINVNYKY